MEDQHEQEGMQARSNRCVVRIGAPASRSVAPAGR
jgi:hypothetical protein